MKKPNYVAIALAEAKRKERECFEAAGKAFYHYCLGICGGPQFNPKG